MATLYNPKIITNGLVLYLDAANPKSYPSSGTTWFDLSGNGNNCVFSSTPTWNNGIFTFNGTTHTGTITNNSTLNFSSEQTIMIVMRHSYTSGRKNPWNQAYAGYGTWTHEAGNSINYYYGDAGGDIEPTYAIHDSGTTPRNVWNFMCTTRNTTFSTWYLNGNATGTFNHSFGTLATTSANISIANGYAGFWPGDIAIVMAYTRALSAQEILQNFNAQRSRFGL
jgi:hypothetical protein